MFEKNVEIKNGLEARPAALLVQIANKYKSSIKIKLDNKLANAKSIMGVISLGIVDGCNLVVQADGEDAEAAVNEMIEFLLKENK